MTISSTVFENVVVDEIEQNLEVMGRFYFEISRKIRYFCQAQVQVKVPGRMISRAKEDFGLTLKSHPIKFKHEGVHKKELQSQGRNRSYPLQVILLFCTDWSLDTSLFLKMKDLKLNVQFLQSFSVSKHPCQAG